MTPFQKRPWLELVLVDSEGDEVATADVIEPLNYKIELTMHIRQAEPAGQYKLIVRLYYPEQADNDRRKSHSKSGRKKTLDETMRHQPFRVPINHTSHC